MATDVRPVSRPVTRAMTPNDVAGGPDPDETAESEVLWSDGSVMLWSDGSSMWWSA